MRVVHKGEAEPLDRDSQAQPGNEITVNSQHHSGVTGIDIKQLPIDLAATHTVGRCN